MSQVLLRSSRTRHSGTSSPDCALGLAGRGSGVTQAERTWGLEVEAALPNSPLQLPGAVATRRQFVKRPAAPTAERQVVLRPVRARSGPCLCLVTLAGIPP